MFEEGVVDAALDGAGRLHPLFALRRDYSSI